MACKMLIVLSCFTEHEFILLTKLILELLIVLR